MFTKNVVVYPRNQVALAQSFGFILEDVLASVSVQDVPGERDATVKDRLVQVLTERLERAVFWFGQHCFEWMHAIEENEGIDVRCSKVIIDLFKSYKGQLDGAHEGCLKGVLGTAPYVIYTTTYLHNQGAADALDNDDDDDKAKQKNRSLQCHNV